MDLEKLIADSKIDPGLKPLAFDTVEALAEHLRKTHKNLMNTGRGSIGYLYRQQVLRNRELQEKLKNERER